MKEALVADLTKAFPDRLAETLARVETVLDHLNLDSGRLHLVGRGDQAVAARSDLPSAHWHDANERTAVQVIHSLLGDLAGDEQKPDLVHIVTFNVDVLTHCGGAQTDIPLRLSASHLANWEPKRARPERHIALHTKDEDVTSHEEPEPQTLHLPDEDAAEDEEGPSRSSKMEAAIREHDHGPYSGFRQRLYDIMNEAIESLSGCSLREFVDRCVQKVRDEGTGESRYLWDRVQATFLKILTEAEVALDADGKPLPTGPRGRTEAIHALAENWQVRADAELAMIIIDSLGGVTEHDYENLAGVLYHDRDNVEFQDKVALLLAELIRQERIEEVREGGTDYVRSCRSMKLLKKSS